MLRLGIADSSHPSVRSITQHDLIEELPLYHADRGPTTTVASPDDVVSSGSFLAEKSSGGILRL